MINYRSLLSIGITVFAVSLFSSSIFSGLVAVPSPSSFPWKSALASPTGNDTGEGSQPPSTVPEEPPVDQPPTVAPPEDGEISVPLSASFTIDSTNGNTAPATYQFEAEAVDGAPPYTYEWDFDDGQTGTGQTIRHTFQNSGTYDVTLTVTDSAGLDVSVSRQVTVQPPTAEPPDGNGTGQNQTEIINRMSVQIEPPGCTSSTNGEHWNKIVFRITGDPTGRIDSSLINTELEVLERVNDGGVINLKDIVRYSIVTEPGILPQLTFDEVEQLEIEILDVEYALICFR